MPIFKQYTTKNIFISSTFVDMQVERDILSKKVLPIVKEFALKYYINVEFVDLRFGIDIGNKNLLDKVVNTCSDEIERCKPLFIGFLGNRFGTEIENSSESITSYEIHKAIKENCESLFYFREITNPDALNENYDKYFYNNDKVTSLKNELLQRYPNSCYSYQSTYNKDKKELVIEEEFVNKIANDINDLIKKLYEDESINNSLPQFEYLSFLHKDYINLDIAASTDLANLFNYEEKISVIYGESGSGKSLLLSNLIKENESDSLVVPFFVAASDDVSLLGVLNTYIEILKLHSNEEFTYISNEKEALDVFYEYLSKTNKKTIVLLDEFEQIKSGDKYDKYSWIKVDEIPNNVKFVITTNYKFDVEKLELDSHVTYCSLVNYDITKTFLDSYLEKINQKVSLDFYDILLNELLKKSNGKPIIFLKTYLEYIFYNDRFDAVTINELSNNAKSRKLTSLDKGVLDFYVKKIKNMDEELDILLPKLLEKKLELLDSSLSNVILSLIALTTTGVRESDIVRVCELLGIQYVSNEFAYLRKIMPSYFYQQKDGSWIFTHRLIKQSFTKYYQKDEEYCKKINDALLIHLKSLDDSDEVKLSNIIPLLYENNEREELKRILLFIIENEQIYYASYFVFKALYILNDHEILYYLLTGDNEVDQEKLAWYLANEIALFANIDMDVFSGYIEFVHEKLTKNTPSTRYFFLQLYATFCMVTKYNDFERIAEGFIKLYMVTENQNIKRSIFDYFFTVISICDDNELANKWIIDLIRLIKRTNKKDKEYYGNLTKVYLEYINHNKDSRKKVDDHIKHVIKYVSSGYVDFEVTGDFINLMFELVIDEYYYGRLDKAKEYIELVLNISSEYRYGDRSLQAIEKTLIIQYFQLIINVKRGMASLFEVEEVKNKFELLYTKSKSPKSAFYLMALDSLKYGLRELDFAKLAEFKQLIENLRNKINEFKYSNLEVYALLYSAVDFMAFTHAHEQNYIYHGKNLGLYENIYQFLIDNDNLHDDFIRMYKRDVLFYLAVTSSKDSIKYYEEEFNLACKYFNDRHDETAILALFNDALHYAYVLSQNNMNDRAIEVFQETNKCIDIYNLVSSNMLYKEKGIIETREMTLMIDKDIFRTFDYVNRVFKYVQSLEQKDVNLVLSANLDALDVIRFKNSEEPNIYLQKLFNKIYDNLSKYCKNYLDSNGYELYEIVEEKIEVDENSSQEDLQKFYFQNIDKAAPITEMNEMDLDIGDQKAVITYGDTEEIDFSEIANLNFTERYLNCYDKNIKANSEYEFWEKQLQKGYLIGFYNIGLMYEKVNRFDEAFEIYQQGASHGCLACLEAMGYLYLKNNKPHEAWECLIKSACGGYILSVRILLNNFKTMLSYHKKYEDLMTAIYNNLASYETEKVNTEALELAKLCIDFGELDIEMYPWFIKYYKFYTKTKTGNITRYMPVEINEYNKDEIEIFRIRKAAIINEDPDAMAHLAYQYFSGKMINVNYKKGLEWTITASKNGNHSMCFYAAMLLYTGDSTLELDCDLAVSLMVRAMKDDESLIEDGLGVLNHIYDHNLGSEKIMTFLKQYLKRN